MKVGDKVEINPEICRNLQLDARVSYEVKETAFNENICVFVVGGQRYAVPTRQCAPTADQSSAAMVRFAESLKSRAGDVEPAFDTYGKWRIGITHTSTKCWHLSAQLTTDWSVEEDWKLLGRIVACFGCVNSSPLFGFPDNPKAVIHWEWM